MSWQAKTTSTPPVKGTSKMLYSPDLVDTANGTYGVLKPEEIHYPTDSGGNLLYYDGLYEVPDGQGYLSVYLSAGNTNTGTYWYGTFSVKEKIGGATVLTGVISGSQEYQYVPAYTPPYTEVSKLNPVAAGPYLVDEGVYDVVFEGVTIYRATGSTPPIPFSSESAPSPAVTQYETTITIGGSSSVTFTLP